MQGDIRKFHFQVIHWYLVPLVALVVWWGMLIAMLACWGAQGHPIYSFMDERQNPVYLSDIGATNLKPLFISCAGFQAIFFVGTLLMEYILRRKNKLQPWVSSKQPKFAIVSIVCAIIGQLGILFVSIFDTKNFHNVHLAMVGVFIAFIFFSCLFNFFNSFIFGNEPTRLHPDHEKVIFGKSRWANLYMVSFWCKLVWLVIAIVLAACFGYYMKHGRDSLSAKFEWCICFWYGFLLVAWSIDLFPSAVKKWKRTHSASISPSSSHEHQFNNYNEDVAFRGDEATMDYTRDSESKYV
ncbi:protein Sfk1p [Diutina catenulata]